MSPARPAAAPIPSSTRERTDCTSSPATAAVPDVPSLPSRPVSPHRSAREREWSNRPLASKTTNRSNPPSLLKDRKSNLAKCLHAATASFTASSRVYRYGRGCCSTPSHFDCRHRSRSTKSPKVLLLRPRFSAAITKTAFLEHGVIGVMGTAAMPSVVLIAYISRAYAVLRNENHHLSCHIALCWVPFVE